MEVNAADVRRAAMDLLARREHAHGELVTKLSRKFGGHVEVIETEIERLRSEGLQSDTRLAEAFIRSRAGRGQGPVKIKAELRGKRVADDTISLAFEACEVDWYEIAAGVHRKRFGEEPPADAKEKAKRSRFLQQRGFSFDQISTIL